MNGPPPVCVAHGHGGSNHGCHSDNGALVESQLTVSLAAKIARLAYPSAHLATADDVDLTPAEVRGIAERSGCEVVIEVHFDAADPVRHGCFYCYRRGDQVARSLGAEVCDALGGGWQGWEMPDANWPRPSALIAAYDGFPVVVLEVANLQNPSDAARLLRKGALDAIAARAAVGIESWTKNKG